MIIAFLSSYYNFFLFFFTYSSVPNIPFGAVYLFEAGTTLGFNLLFKSKTTG